MANDSPQTTPYGRRISDPAALRALAHAGRYAILQRLQDEGPATATEVAEVAGLSPSACSYHLRLLARHGFVEPDDSRGRDGRERAWRATTAGWVTEPEPDADPRLVRAVDSTLVRAMIASSDAMVLDFVDRGAIDRAWRDAALQSNSTIVATAEELAELSLALMAVLRPYLLSNRPLDTAPPGARLVHTAIRMAPRLPHADGPPDPGPAPRPPTRSGRGAG